MISSLASPTSADTPKQHVALVVLAAGSTQAQPCETPLRGRLADAAMIARIVQAKESNFVVDGPYVGKIDFSGALASPSETRFIVATYCKQADVYNVTLAGYDYVPAHPPSAAKILQGSVNGTLDAVAAADWSGLLGTPPAPLVPNIAFLPVSNDTNNIVNPRMIRNLPLTAIATPAPAPTATPAPGTPAIPTTRYDECRSSADHVLVSGRIVITGNPTNDDISKLAIGAAAIKQSAPNPWGSIYTGVGVVLAALYGPNRAEVGADVFMCPNPDGVVYWVAGDSITGHAATPLLNPSPEQTQRALDLAANDLNNQLFCILRNELPNAEPSLHGPLPAAFNTWCTNYFAGIVAKIRAAPPVEAPIPAFKTSLEERPLMSPAPLDVRAAVYERSTMQPRLVAAAEPSPSPSPSPQPVVMATPPIGTVPITTPVTADSVATPQANR